MNFLELCKRVRQEAGISGTGPSSVLNQGGEMRRVVDWVISAWTEIQLTRKNWMWMRGSFSFQTVANDHDYSASEADIAARFRMWDRTTLRLYKTSEGVANEFYIPFISYHDYLMVYMTGTQTPTRPVCFTVAPDMKLLLGPKPDGEYTVRGDYWKASQTLAADEDIPEMPEEYHLYIVAAALEKYALYESATEVLARARQDKRFYKNQVEATQLPPMEMAEPLC